MAAPAFRAESETAWNTSPATTKTTSSFNVTAGDYLAAFGMAADFVAGGAGITVSGGGLTWTQNKQINQSNFSPASMYTASASANTSMTTTFTWTGGTTFHWGGNVLIFASAAGIGTSVSATAASQAPSVSMTTTSANSAIVIAWGDFAAVNGSARTWRTNAGTLTEQTYAFDSGNYTVYGGFHADAGAAAAYALGATAPTAQKPSMVAVEILGITASGGGVVPKNLAALGVG